MSLGPAAAFVVATKIAFYGGLVISSPFIFYFAAHFIFPALRMREKKYVYSGLAFGFGLFSMGVCFCYFIMMPLALAVSAQYAEWFGFKANQWRAEEYISFVCKFMLGMGLGFRVAGNYPDAGQIGSAELSDTGLGATLRDRDQLCARRGPHDARSSDAGPHGHPIIDTLRGQRLGRLVLGATG